MIQRGGWIQIFDESKNVLFIVLVIKKFVKVFYVLKWKSFRQAMDGRTDRQTNISGDETHGNRPHRVRCGASK